MPIASLTSDWFFVCGVDVVASAETGGVVTLGDSLTDCNVSTIDAFCRWPDQLARRLMARPRGRPMAVMNQGLGGNRILFDIRGESGLRRFDRDVLSQPGVTHVIVMLGTNDLRNRWKKPEEEPTAAQMIAGLNQMAVRAHSAGIKIIGATLTPFGNETYMANAWNPQREEVRLAVNDWIRAAAPSMVSPISTRPCVTRRYLPRCGRATIAATVSTRAILATTRWETSSICRCSNSAAADRSRRPRRRRWSAHRELGRAERVFTLGVGDGTRTLSIGEHRLTALHGRPRRHCVMPAPDRRIFAKVDIASVGEAGRRFRSDADPRKSNDVGHRVLVAGEPGRLFKAMVQHLRVRRLASLV